ncbi:hypothetical protein HYDPIDRAFT_110778 [Hydnomerulius pinastri MD-312]|nr:hypothetical protein HYDPIDRAFT_110778 [Hydnomerulius pinastri MD-312]
MSTPKEKVPESLPGPIPRQTPSKTSSISTKTALIAFAVLATTLLVKSAHIFCQSSVPHDLANAEVCPQVSELVPEKNNAIWKTLSNTYGTEAFKMRAVNWLSGAVQIPTESYDSMEPVGVDPRWEKFAPFHDYLLKAFPLVHSSLELTKINTYAMIFVWKGSDSTLKPLLLAAHQDVVPVEPTTYDEWTHPPFSGYFDGELVWGRGSSDDKSGLIAIFSALETMLANGYQPTRTVVFASGFDEECGGGYGAGTLAPKLLEMFGENGYAMLLDEGAGYGEQYGQVIATPGIAEKGSVSVTVEVTSPGGHSSLPPPHTSIGMLAELLVTFEKNPFEVHLARGSPTYQSAQCLARHAPELPASLRRDILHAQHSDKALRAAEKQLFQDPAFKNLVGTTQAIDIVHGGVKVNALPEQAFAIVNHRISTESTVAATKSRDINLLKSLASDFNLSYTAFGANINDVNSPAYGTLTLSAAYGKEGLEPAPITPTEGDAVPYEVLSGTIKAAYNSHRGVTGNDNIIISPGIMSGNTDTKFYWKLTPHIFRYGHTGGAGGGKLTAGVHTVDEALPITNFVEMIRFFTTLVLNVDESSLP